MKQELYVVALYKEGKFVDFLRAGRPFRVAVYESFESSARAVKQKEEELLWKNLVPIGIKLDVPVEVFENENK